MKVFIFLFFTAVFSLNSSNGFSQNAKIRIDSDKTISVEEIFELIKKETNYKFVYRPEHIKDAPQINLVKGEIKASILLKKGLDPIGLTYKFIDNTVIVAPKIHTDFGVPVQEVFTINGVVNDKFGMPIVGATVFVSNIEPTKNKKSSDFIMRGTTTGFDGKFTLEVALNNFLAVQTLGYEFKYFKLTTKQKNYNITLIEQVSNLDEVIISTGYQKISKERTTGSYSKINNKKLDQRPVTDIVSRLEGTVAGLNIVRDQDGNASFQIRGLSTLRADANALIVVDGFPIEGDLSTINPQDIESVTVLKDATAASIWGVRASNGVVVVTTKKGKRGEKLSITASSYVSITEGIDYAKQNYMSTSDQVDMSLEYYNKGWFGPAALLNFGIPVSSALDLAYMNVTGTSPDGDVWSQAQFSNFINDLKTRSSERQWEKYLLRSPIRNTYNISISGGSEKNTFYGSLAYDKESLASIGNSSDRFIFNLQDIYKLNDKISFNAGVTVLLNASNLNGVNPSAIETTKAFEDLVDANGNLIQYYNVRDPWTSRSREAIDGVSSYTFNQLEEQRNSDHTNERFSIRAKFGVDYNILKDLKISSSFQYEKGAFNTDQYNTMSLPSHRVRVNEFFVNGVNLIPLGTEYKFSREDFYAWDFRNTITWDKNWTNHKLNVFAGTEIRKNVKARFSNKVYGYNRQADTSIPVDQVAFTSEQVVDWTGLGRINSFSEKFYESIHTDEREFSMFLNAGYQFLNKYSVNGSFRVDQKNLFGSDPSFRYKPLWSVGLGWNIAKEDFLDNLDVVNTLKLRATYGVVGNASNEFSPFAQAVNRISTREGISFNYLDLVQAANEQLKWEETRVFNAGLDFGLFNNRLYGSLEYYSRDSQDLLGSIEFDPTVGFSSAVVNYASMTNKGIELDVNAIIIDTENFKWNSNLNFSYNNNKVTEIENSQTAPVILFGAGKIAVGEAANTLYAINFRD